MIKIRTRQRHPFRDYEKIQDIEVNYFPDGTQLLHFDPTSLSIIPEENLGVDVIWLYEKDEELVTLIYITKQLKRLERLGIKLRLIMPYIPNARQDRVKNDGDIFTLKYFADIINDLKFYSIHVFDPHSNVATALINNIRVYRSDIIVEAKIREMIDEYGEDSVMYFYPDEGACKRYSTETPIVMPYAFGVKKRDWETGEIKKLDIVCDENIEGKNILIVDDICSRGGTFYHSAKALKEKGVNDIHLCVSHCENTILEGELLEGDLIKKVITTNSIFTKKHDKIEVVRLW